MWDKVHPSESAFEEAEGGKDMDVQEEKYFCEKCGGEVVRDEDLDQVPDDDDPLVGELVWIAWRCLECGEVEFDPLD